MAIRKGLKLVQQFWKSIYKQFFYNPAENCPYCDRSTFIYDIRNPLLWQRYYFGNLKHIWGHTISNETFLNIMVSNETFVNIMSSLIMSFPHSIRRLVDKPYISVDLLAFNTFITVSTTSSRKHHWPTILFCHFFSFFFLQSVMATFTE